jgi:uncharacterized protein YkwD
VRHGAHERSLHENAALRDVAGHQVADMVRFNYFSDIPPSGQPLGALIAAAHYAPRSNLLSGEDIGWGTRSLATPSQILRSWLRSAPHRAIMLDPRYRDIGVGVIPAVPRSFSGGQGGATYAIDLGLRLR